MGPDFRVLVAKARKSAQAYWKVYGEYPSVKVLVQEVATVMQEATQSGSVLVPSSYMRRVSILILCGMIEEYDRLEYRSSSQVTTRRKDTLSTRSTPPAHSGRGKPPRLERITSTQRPSSKNGSSIVPSLFASSRATRWDAARSIRICRCDSSFPLSSFPASAASPFRSAIFHDRVPRRSTARSSFSKNHHKSSRKQQISRTESLLLAQVQRIPFARRCDPHLATHAQGII